MQNLRVAQSVALGMRHVENNAADITKKVKVDVLDFDGRRDLHFFLDCVGLMDKTDVLLLYQEILTLY